MSKIKLRKDQGEKFKYISSTFIHSTTFAGSGQHPSIRYLPVNCVSLRYTRCRPTHQISVQWWARVAAHCLFNAGQLCTTLAQHHSNTDRTHDSSTPASTAIIGRLTNVASMLIQRVWRWPSNNPALCIHRLLCGNCYWGDNFIPRGQKGHYPDTLAQLWNNVKPPFATLGQHYSNKTLEALIIDSSTNIIGNYIISEHLLKTKVLNVRTWNVILVHEDWYTEMSTVSHT